MKLGTGILSFLYNFFEKNIKFMFHVKHVNKLSKNLNYIYLN